MKKIFRALFLAGTIALGGCATVGGNRIDPNAVIAAVTQACAFVPETSSVTAIIAALSGNVAAQGVQATVASIAAQICAAVTARSTRRGVSVPTVAGVPVTGHFLNGRRVGPTGPSVGGVPVTGYFVR